MLGVTIEERIQALPRCGSIGELCAAEPVDLVSLQPQIAVCRHHRSVPRSASESAPSPMPVAVNWFSSPATPIPARSTCWPTPYPDRPTPSTGRRSISAHHSSPQPRSPSPEKVEVYDMGQDPAQEAFLRQHPS